MRRGRGGDACRGILPAPSRVSATPGSVCVRGPRGLLPRRPRLVRDILRCAHPRPAGRLESDRRRRPRIDPRAHGLGKDTGRLPLGDRPTLRGAAARRSQGEDTGPVRVAAPGARRGHREEPSRAAGRHPACGRPARHAARTRTDGRHQDRRHALARPAADDPAPTGHPDHHAGVAVPDAHLLRTRDAQKRANGDRRRDPCDGGVQARSPPGALARASGGALRRPAAADRALRHATASRGDRTVPRRIGRRCRTAGDDRGRRTSQAHGAAGGGPGRGHGRGHRARRPCARVRRRRRARRQGADALDLAVDPSPAARADPRASVHDRVHERPAAGGASRSEPERARGGGSRARAPRIARARTASRGRGRPEGRAPQGDRRHVLARTRDRHGRRGSRDPGRVSGLRRERPAAHRAGRPQGRRALQGPHLPEVPRRPARGGGGGRADARRRDRAHQVPAQPPRRARAAARRDVCGRGTGRGRALRRRAALGVVRRALQGRVRGGPRHARRPLSERRIRGAAAPSRVGPARRHRPGARRRGPDRHHVRRHHPRSRPVRRLPPRRGPRRGARRRDGLREPPG